MSREHPVGREENGPVGTEPPLPGDAAAARAMVRELLDEQFCSLGGMDPDDVVISDAMLVTSELVTNAIRHGGGLTGFRARLSGEGLLLDVADASPREPRTVPSLPGTVRVGGYGWPLVRRLSSRVTITREARGKRISVLITLF
ncbi:ATP-binding protein [Streptomyces sp. NBC_00102]|uniref:ATP-binding protein n=1 Tax=Streptomyces sp. NBC_00102 TaxID=2975652 RepID=UPI002252AE96|nr:ATP-binding protein [Streptomyces sp. NBC_00102]MCX5401275.1 ATP-binding protein [Streptomyces sp. NBC_00102]